MREGVAEGERRFKDGPGWRRNLGELKGDGCRRHDEEGTRPAERGERRQKKGRKEESPNRRGAVGIADSVCVHGVCLATLALSLCGSRCHCLTGGNAIILLISRNRRGCAGGQQEASSPPPGQFPPCTQRPGPKGWDKQRWPPAGSPSYGPAPGYLLLPRHAAGRRHSHAGILWPPRGLGRNFAQGVPRRVPLQIALQIALQVAVPQPPPPDLGTIAGALPADP